MVLCSAMLIFGTGCGLAANNTEPVQGKQVAGHRRQQGRHHLRPAGLFLRQERLERH